MTICMYLLVVLTDMTGTLLVYLTQWGHDLGNTNKWVEGFSPKNELVTLIHPVSAGAGCMIQNVY